MAYPLPRSFSYYGESPTPIQRAFQTPIGNRHIDHDSDRPNYRLFPEHSHFRQEVTPLYPALDTQGSQWARMTEIAGSPTLCMLLSGIRIPIPSLSFPAGKFRCRRPRTTQLPHGNSFSKLDFPGNTLQGPLTIPSRFNFSKHSSRSRHRDNSRQPGS